MSKTFSLILSLDYNGKHRIKLTSFKTIVFVLFLFLLWHLPYLSVYLKKQNVVKGKILTLHDSNSEYGR